MLLSFLQNLPDWMDRYDVGEAVTLFAVWVTFFLVHRDARPSWPTFSTSAYD